MSYMRAVSIEQPYIWSDGERLHIWSHRPENAPDFASATSISEAQFRFIAVLLVSELVDELKLPSNMRRAFDKIIERLKTTKGVYVRE